MCKNNFNLYNQVIFLIFKCVIELIRLLIDIYENFYSESICLKLIL